MNDSIVLQLDRLLEAGFRLHLWCPITQIISRGLVIRVDSLKCLDEKLS